MSGYEQQFISEAFESNYIAPLGPQVDAFEKEFAEKVGISHAVALSSGTAAIHLAILSLGVAPGDMVFASTLTFIGSVSPITFCRGVPVFLDADKVTWNIDPDLLEEEINRCAKKGQLPKAIIPTDLYGQCIDMDRILEICKPYEIPVIADAAEALGSTYKGRSAGARAKAAVFSFNGNKIITTSGGGMLASNDKALIENASYLSQQARDVAPHYEHSQIGFNYRMSNILAAIGRGQLKVLDERVKRKREIFDYYDKALGDIPGIEFMPEAPYSKSSRWLTVILITLEEFGADREEVRIALEGENIESRPVWKPMHMQPVFDCESATPEKYASHFTGQADERRPTQIFFSRTSRGKNSRRFEEKLPKKRIKARVIGGEVAEDLFNRGLCLPSGTAMTEGDLDRVVSTILKCRKQ